MEKIKIAFIAAAIAAVSLFSYGQTAIDVLINDADFKGETISQYNALLDAFVAANVARQGDITVLTDTNANIVLTTKVPTGTEATFLYAPNGTNITLAVNFTSSTNSWIEVVVPE
jgi:hypothetical protein